MNFFDREKSAKQASFLLLLLFVLALALLILVVNAGAALGLAAVYYWSVPIFFLTGADLAFFSLNFPFVEFWRNWLQPAFWPVSITALLMFTWDTCARHFQLRWRSDSLAGLLDATEVLPHATTPETRVLANVVAEMAIAAGLPVPRIFVMQQEDGINAFVERQTDGHALVVTKGCLDKLVRNELQAIAAFGISQMLNADDRLNRRILVLMAGLSSVCLLGKEMQNDTPAASSLLAPGQFALPRLIGLILYFSGYPGLFLARLIKAAFSRQRNLLADASILRLTRDPSGLAGVLSKINQGPGSLLSSRYAEDINHMCFAQAVDAGTSRWTNCHGNIFDRLDNTLPGWAEQPLRYPEPRPRKESTEDPLPPLYQAPLLLEFMQSLVAGLPGLVRESLESAAGALLLVYALLSQSGIKRPPPVSGETDTGRLRTLSAQLLKMGPETRLPLAEMALPALRGLPSDRKQDLLAYLKACKNDKDISLFGFLLGCLVQQRLAGQAGSAAQLSGSGRLDRLADSIRLVFSWLAYESGKHAGEASRLYRLYAAPSCHAASKSRFPGTSAPCLCWSLP